MKNLFDERIRCPSCFSEAWSSQAPNFLCAKCGYVSQVERLQVNLLPPHLSRNNSRELSAYAASDQVRAAALLNYSIQKPWNYPPFIRDQYLREISEMRLLAADLGPSPSVLFVFGGGGMEAHLSSLLGSNTVIADISKDLLIMAELRFRHYDTALPAAFVQCDAERLPFKSDSFDLVVGFEGAHHCLSPQAAMHEIWRVAKRRSFIVDNYECALTNLLSRFGLSSRLEESGVFPGRFSRVMLESMLHNAGIKHYSMRARTALPHGAIGKLGPGLSGAATKLLNLCWQTNMFAVTVYHD